ncbi:LamG-like jellyroll fold domain-containing protein [Actinopolymorpha pittospori]|uniref:DNA-binding beta-propeller fold protein YncE n=1 Tax=Actinopolymorpha pittospori TaxID=648752 RepID=A0A927MQW2_9ACTN|nr:LamG-like jellyroll fold domain-containing protein [Actinopolymorpha pittospori]MBE1603578.1 DNA-binding beta-propeller fold protein YncE [Actinopolymorpha pittospori]
MTGPTAVLDSMQLGLTAAYQRGMERLTLPLGGTDGAGITTVPAYDFGSYRSRYAGRLPQSPRYLVVPQAPPTVPATVRVWFTRDAGLPEESVDVVVPAGAAAGVAVPLGAAAAITPTLRLTRFQPQPPADQTAAAWQLVGLLGNLAKLLWVIGAEHAELGALLTDVAAQRNAATAHGASLDLLGGDLWVPRFPPRPYAWDPDTIALYHLDDRPSGGQPEVVTVADDRARYESTSHPGTNSGGRSGQPGRFSYAFGFSTRSPAQVTVPDHADFALPAGSGFTVEAVVKPDRAVTTPGAVVAKRNPLNAPAGTGWALTVGSYRGIDHNVRFSVADGSREYELFADVDLADGRSHHVAGVLDRTGGTTGRLYLDGALVANSRFEPLGALTSAEPLRLGRGNELVANTPTDAQYAGLIDEVRLSTVARSSFHPVVGEGDDEYRRRLRVFQRWLLPTPDALLNALTELVGPVGGDPRPFVLDEGVDPLTTGTLPMRVLPGPFAPGAGIAADGDVHSTEAAAVGVVEDESGFDPAWLRPHENRPKLDFGGVAEHRLMQWSVRAALGRLLDRLAPVTGSLRVLRAYDPEAGDLSRIGRALLLAHETLPPGELAVHAFAAGFGWVRRTGSGEVHVAQAAADSFRILPAPAVSGTALPDLIEGGTLTLSLDPDPGPLADAEVRWSVSRCGPGEAAVTLAGKKAVLQGVAAGTLSVRAEVVRRRHTAGGSRTVRIGLSDTALGVGGSITGDGTRGVAEAAAAGAPHDDFDEVYLVTRTDDLTGEHPNVAYGTDPANRRMQRVTGLALDRLLGLLTGAGAVTVVKAYDPAGAGLLAQGRALWLRHSTLTAPALAARAFAAGFDFVRVDAGPPQTVQVAVSAGEQIGVTGPAEVAVGTAVTASASPQADPSAVAFAADGSRAYVANRASARVTALTLAGTATAFPALTLDRSAWVQATPVALAFAAGKLYVAHELPGTVSVLDPVTLAPTGTQISTGPQPVALATAGTRLFVGCAGDRTIRAYDTGTGAQVATGTVPDTPLSLAVVPGGSTLYAVLAGNRFCRVDLTTLVAGAAIATGAGAAHAVVSPNGAKLYVSCAADDPADRTGTVRIYQTATNTQSKVVDGFPADAAPGAMAIGADGRFLYVATSGPGRVHVLDAATDTLLAPVFTPAGPTRWPATSPAGAAYPAAVVAVSAGTVVLGDPAPLGQTPQRAPRVMTAVRLGSGAGEQLSWATVPFSRGQVELSSVVSPTIRVTGAQPGSTLVRVVSVRGDHLLPYQFEVRLVPALDADPTVTLTKDQYDLVMNILNWFHPIGVEVRTDRLRAHVVELGSADADLAPAYTFPQYRFPGLPAPGPTQG